LCLSVVVVVFFTMAEVEELYHFKLCELKNFEYDKKGKSSVSLYFKGKCLLTGQSVKTPLVDSGSTVWNETLDFSIPRKKSKKPGDRTIVFKLMAKGHVRDDVVGEYTLAVDDVTPTATDSWITLEKKKGYAEIRLEKKVDRSEDSGDAPAAASSGSDDVPEGVESKYTMGREIGRGGFSIVYDGTSKATGKKVAIKVIDKKKQDGEQLVLLQREIDIMKRLKHPNIVALYDVFDDPTHISLVLEYVSGGELYDEIVKRGSFTESDACTVLRQVLSATEYLHENGIAHRDLKPENLLISSESGGLQVKIADFGLSKDFSDSAAMTTCCGSPSYVAPEVLQQGMYNNSCDIWSIGVILYVLLSGFLPFFGETQEELFDKILTGSYSFANKVWDEISPTAKDLVTKMLTLNEEDRPTAKQCLEHPWFKASNPRKQLRSVESLRDLRSGIKVRPT